MDAHSNKLILNLDNRFSISIYFSTPKESAILEAKSISTAIHFSRWKWILNTQQKYNNIKNIRTTKI